MKGLKILILEDEPLIAIHLEKMLLDLGYGVSDKATTAREAIGSAISNPPDLLLCDIHLSDNPLERDGIHAAKVITEKLDIPVIFITQLEDKLEESLKTIKPLGGFLVKPYNLRDLKINIEMAIANHSRTSLPAKAGFMYKDRIYVKSDNKNSFSRIDIAEILYLKAAEAWTEMFTLEEKKVFSEHLSKFYERIADLPCFERIHRSYIVNLDRVEAISDISLSIHHKENEDPIVLPISRKYRGVIRERFKLV